MTIGPPGDDIPRVARRLPSRSRRLSRFPVSAAIAAYRSQASEQDMPATRHPSARGAGTVADVTIARQRMREFMRRRGGRGVTITMIVNRLASEQLDVTRSTVRRWLADDIERRVAERVEPGLYCLRQRGGARRRPRRQQPRERGVSVPS